MTTPPPPIPFISETELQDPTKISNLVNDLFKQVEQYAQESMKWPKLYQHDNITTHHLKKQGKGPHKFLQRSSIHKPEQVTYDQLRALLYVDHSLNEPKYMESLQEAKLLKKLNEEADIVWLGFKTPPLSSNREFVELVATREIGRSFMAVSQPVQLLKDKVEKGYVRGAYQAWEIVTEKQDKSVEWICIQHSSAGGNIPAFISDWVAARDFHHDVNSIIKYIKEEQKN